MKDSLTAALCHSREQAQSTYNRWMANKKGCTAGFSQVKGQGGEGGQFHFRAEQPRKQPIGDNYWTIHGPDGRRQHIKEAIHPPGVCPSIPPPLPGLLALVQKWGRGYLLAASGQQSMV